MVMAVPFFMGISLIKLSSRAILAKIPLAGPQCLIVSFWIMSIYVNFFKFYKVISQLLFITSFICFLNLHYIELLFPMQNITIDKNREVVSVPTTKKVVNQSIRSLSVYQKGTLVFSFSQMIAWARSVHGSLIYSLASYAALLANISAAFSLNNLILSLIYLILLVSPSLYATLPKRIIKGVIDSQAAVVVTFIITSQKLLPFILQSIQSQPKKHLIITLLNILEVKL